MVRGPCEQIPERHLERPFGKIIAAHPFDQWLNVARVLQIHAEGFGDQKFAQDHPGGVGRLVVGTGRFTARDLADAGQAFAVNRDQQGTFELLHAKRGLEGVFHHQAHFAQFDPINFHGLEHTRLPQRTAWPTGVQAQSRFSFRGFSCTLPRL